MYALSLTLLLFIICVTVVPRGFGRDQGPVVLGVAHTARGRPCSAQLPDQTHCNRHGLVCLGEKKKIIFEVRSAGSSKPAAQLGADLGSW